MAVPLQKEREQVASVMRRLYRQGLTTCSGGNVSMRCGEEVLITASGTDKGEIAAAGVGIVTLGGEKLTPKLRLSMETEMHLEIYRNRPDAAAVVHAHPATASAFAAMEREIDTRLTAETWQVLGRPVIAPYALMGTASLASLVGRASREGSTIIMENHGVVTVGGGLLQAFERMELLEAAAKMTWIIESMGAAPRRLSGEQLHEIEEKYGGGSRNNAPHSFPKKET